MKQATYTIGQTFLIAFAIIGVLWVIGEFLKILFPEPAPMVHVTVNLPESKPKELTAGDHAKGLLNIAWSKTVEKILLPFA
ncbi:MAG: hypothetical protein PHY43_10240 [Verrucomicrobiales bacterium]|nr:hypothetical protein [Verrucomicrobiales bacterium]